MTYNLTDEVLKAFVGDAETNEHIGPHNLANALRKIIEDCSYIDNSGEVVNVKNIRSVIEQLDDF
jgi:hypothetical protein